jgi:serine/threonine-protein phosphatase 2B regulatory subunit
MMAGENLSPLQLQQLVDRTIRDCDKDGDGKLNLEEFRAAVSHLSLSKQLDVDV